MTGFLMQRAEQAAPETWWLRWVGPWQYQISASQMNQYTAAPCQNYRRSFYLFTIPVFRIRRIAHYGVGKGGLNHLAASGMALLAKIIPGRITNRVTSWPDLTLSSNSSRLLAGR
jgi:hypothetical protein